MVSDNYFNEPMIDMYIFETSQLLEQLEQTIISSEGTSSYSSNTIDEIFRIMHTIKGSSAMMLFNNIANLTHSVEEVFYFIREQRPKIVDTNTLSDLILESIDFIKEELEKIKNSKNADGNSSGLIDKINTYLSSLKDENLDNQDSIQGDSRESEPKKIQQYYISQTKKINLPKNNGFKATVHFVEDCKMENIRAYTVIHNLREITEEIHHIPENIIDSDDAADQIRENGFIIYLKTEKNYEEIKTILMDTVFLKKLDLVEIDDLEEINQILQESKEIENNIEEKSLPPTPTIEKEFKTFTQQNIISVNVTKLDKLMDLVGEMVIAEAMVTQNPDIKDLELHNFYKAARQLNKITSEIQDMVMSIRMVPLATTFHRMHRIVRDMCKKLDKEVTLNIVGEETEVDKNIIEHISDPLMHLVRNAIDHGIETKEERTKKEKSKIGTITLEAKNAGSDVQIIIRDDGKGLNKEGILNRAEERGLLNKSVDEMTDKEIYSLIFLPGFSTKENVTEFSGRGVGMDVVTKNIEKVGGSVSVDSSPSKGTVVTLKIPLTLAIIEGMNISVGKSYYTIPITSIKESFRPKKDEVITDPDGSEMIMVRGQCYPIFRLHELYNIKTDITDFTEGIIVMVENDEKSYCIFADQLLGQQQVVVKTLPNYIKKTRNIKGLAGCTLLGDGSISLILDITGLVK